MMYGQEYGPWNALADVLGAYMQKKDLDGALNYAQNVGTMVDKATAPKMVQNPVKPEQYGTQAAKKAEQYLVATGKMPNPDWLGQNVQQPADAATRAFMNYVPQGVQAAQPANGSIMAAAQNAIQPTGQNFLQSPAQNVAQALQANGQMPKLDWLGQGTAPQQSLLQSAQAQATPSTTDVANEMAGAAPAQPAQTAPAPAQPAATPQATKPNHPQSIMQAMQDFAARNNPNNPTPAQQAALQKKNADFAAAKAANPQWYEGNWYVGDDKDARAKAKATQAQQAQQKAAILSQGNNPENGRFSSGMEQYGFTGQKEAPLSYDQYVSKTKQLKIQAMRDIINKYGADAAKKAESLIDSAISDKNSEYADQIDAHNRQELGRFLLNGDINSPQGMRQALWGTVEYNKTAQKMGKPTVDTAMLGKMLDSGKVSITAKDVGGSINFYAVPKDGGTFGNDKNGNPIYIRPIMSQGKSLAPKDKASIAISQAKLAEERRHNVAQEGLTARGQNMRAAYAGRGGSGRGGSRGGGSFKSTYGPAISAITKSIEDGHSKSYIYTQFSDAGGSEEEWNQLWTRSVENYYHKVQGDDADDGRDYLDGDGNPES